MLQVIYRSQNILVISDHSGKKKKKDKKKLKNCVFWPVCWATKDISAM